MVFKVNLAFEYATVAEVVAPASLRSTSSINKPVSSWDGTNLINQQGILSIYAALQLMTGTGFERKKSVAANYHSPEGH